MMGTLVVRGLIENPINSDEIKMPFKTKASKLIQLTHSATF